MDKIGAQHTIGGLLIIIGILIIVYVLVLPPCEKCQLLDEGSCTDVCQGQEIEGILLLENIGDVASKDEVIHSMSPANLYIRVEDSTENLADSLIINRGWFGNIDQDLSFAIEDLENLDGVYLTFKVIDSRGKLFIELNNHIIVSEYIDSPESKIISLPLSYLSEKNNIKLYVDSPGLAFWTKNRYTINDLTIKQEFERVHHEENRVFSVSDNELKHLKSSSLDFSIVCGSSTEEGLNILKIYLNNELISSKAIECESSKESISLTDFNLKKGENEVKFVLDNGNFLLSPIEVINKLDTSLTPSYSFEIEDSEFEFADQYLLSLHMGEGNKQAQILINNKKISLDTDEVYFERDITGFIRKGENRVEIAPVTNFVVDEIKIWYE